MSDNSNADDSQDRTDTKYSTDLSPSDEGVVSLRDDDETEAESVSPTKPQADEAEPSPENNATETYEVGTLPPTFSMVINPKAWHPSWGPVPTGFEAVVSRTQATLSAPGEDSYGTTDDGQPVARDNFADSRATHADISPGLGVEFGSGWQPRWVPDWQVMERQLAETGVDLAGSGGDRLEAAIGEEQIERERRRELPSQEDVHTFYTPEEPLSEDSDVMRLWDAADDDAVTDVESILGETGDTTEDIMSMPEAIEEVRSYTKECAAQRARDCRQAVDEMNITNATQPAFDTFDYNGNQTDVSKQAALRAPDHRPFHRDFARQRPLGGFDPKWGSWQPKTETVSVGPHGTCEIEVATDPIMPISYDRVAHAERGALRDRFGESTLETLEKYVIRILDRVCEASGVESEDTYYADYSDSETMAHPANDNAAVTVAPDGSIATTTDAFAPGVPSVSRLREAYEQALTDTRDPLAAVGSTLERLWHVGTQSLAEIQPEWPGCSVLARVSRAYVPNDPASQQQVVYLEDVAPSATSGTQIGDEVKFTVWQNSYIDTYVAEGDILAISNPVPGEFNGSLTLAATGKTTISRLVKSNGSIKRAMDARGKLTGSNDGAQRVGSADVAPEVGGVIDDDDSVTRLPNKRYRRVGATIRRGPPEETKHTRVHTPMREQRCPMAWTFPITDWVREHAPIPEVGESIQTEEVVGHAVSVTSEPAEITDTNSVTVTRDTFVTVLERLSADSSSQVVGNRPRDAVDPEASVTIYTDPDALGGIDSVTAVVSPHPAAPQSTEVRVHSGVPLSPDDSPTTIRVVEWDCDTNSPQTVLSPITHTIGWETRLLNQVRQVRNSYADTEQKESITSQAKQVVATESRPIRQTPTGAFSCPVCEYTGQSIASVRGHMGGRAGKLDDKHRALGRNADERTAQPSTQRASSEVSTNDNSHGVSASDDTPDFVVGTSDDGTDVVDMSKL